MWRVVSVACWFNLASPASKHLAAAGQELVGSFGQQRVLRGRRARLKESRDVFSCPARADGLRKLLASTSELP